MPKVTRARTEHAAPGPYSRLPQPMPPCGTMPRGTPLWVGRDGQWVMGTVERWFGDADDSSHWYELMFAQPEGARAWHDLAPARRAIGTARGGSWAFPQDEDISACSSNTATVSYTHLTLPTKA